MKREILFRGKRPNSGKWIQGFLFENKLSSWILSDRFTSPECSCEVIPDSVGQFTGLTDKNGVKIFEGDKLSNDKGEVGYIIFYEGKFCLNAKRKNGNQWYMPIDIGFLKNKIVIGNFHEL